MGKRALLNLALAVLAVVLILIVYLEPGIDEPQAPVPVTDLAATDVARVLIRHADGGEIELQRREGRWDQVAPLQVVANRTRVEMLLQLTDAVSHGRFDLAGEELVRFGLDSPAAELHLDDTVFAFGDTEPIDRRRYVRVGGSVHLVEDRYLRLLEMDAPEYASNQLLPEGSQPVRLDLPEYSLVRDQRGDWSISPEREAISADSLNRIVDAWVHARAISMDRYRDEASRGVVSVQLRHHPQRIEYHIVEFEPGLALARPALGLVYHLGSEQGRRLMDPAPQLEPPP